MHNIFAITGHILFLFINTVAAGVWCIHTLKSA